MLSHIKVIFEVVYAFCKTIRICSKKSLHPCQANLGHSMHYTIRGITYI